MEHQLKEFSSERAYIPQSKTDVHITPDDIYKLIEETWGIKKESMFDPCPVEPTFDGLRIRWKEWNYVNPPFDKETLVKFLTKAIGEYVTNNNRSIMLLPTKTDQDWFHDIILANKFEIKWIRGRIKFKGESNNAPPPPHFLVKIG